MVKIEMNNMFTLLTQDGKYLLTGAVGSDIE